MFPHLECDVLLVPNQLVLKHTKGCSDPPEETAEPAPIFAAVKTCYEYYI